MISLRFRPDLYRMIREAAAAEGLGIGAYLVRLIENSLTSSKIGRGYDKAKRN